MHKAKSVCATTVCIGTRLQRHLAIMASRAVGRGECLAWTLPPLLRFTTGTDQLGPSGYVVKSFQCSRRSLFLGATPAKVVAQSLYLSFVPLLVLVWCWALLHVPLEAAGWAGLHEHHSHSHDSSQGHGSCEEETSRAARGQSTSRVSAPSMTIAWSLKGLHRLPPIVKTQFSGVPERPTAQPVPWHFLQRCAPQSLAPPAIR